MVVPAALPAVPAVQPIEIKCKKKRMCIDHVLGRVTGNEVEMESNKNNYSRHVEKRWSTFSFHLFCEGRGLYEAEKDVVESH